MKKYLVESALLTHGLKSVSNEKILSVWKQEDKNIVWIEQGKIRIGDIQEFCEFRLGASPSGRINYFNFEKCLKEEKTGCLTASGTIKVCEIMGIPIVITCGIGGLMTNNEKEICRDIEAMAKSSVSMVATAPKDMFDLDATIMSMKRKNIQVVGIEKDYCNGYLFLRERTRLEKKWDGGEMQGKTLYLHGIPESERIDDLSILKEAYQYGKKKEERGELFHPAVNRKIDEMTNGISSEIQLHSLWENVLWVESL